MAQEDPNRLAEWLAIVRAQAPVLRDRVGEWIAAVRQEPALLWQTAAARYAVYVFGATLLLWGGQAGIGMLTLPLPPEASKAATTADFHVVCSNASCGHHFVIHREFGFRRFPIECPRCTRATGVRARPCNSTECRGRWVPPTGDEGATICPHCGGAFD